ncbi:Mechanosensitive ion channel [Nannocystis exedens]|uniref:Mechanosensitive ion channel n=1 Tax=Nannocystis exedens TaxID=54 RepID=A0A1I1VV42_9BACT|nr:mechanosensitive ion channel domain-containing protein [Nannocystis exedens]PCC72856.1 Mechanosensitive ion channel [Nannocystis exedens]SFD86599.1 Mechanosensitive ion channel [Nannocystis exedens]
MLVALAIDPLSASTSLIARLFPVVYIGGLVALGLLVSFVLRKLATVEAFRQVHPWIPLLHLAVWLPLVWLLQHRFVPAASGADWWSRGLWLLVFAVAALPWLRSVFLGVVFAVEARYKIGDDLRIGDVEGRLVGVGLRAITLRGLAGIDATIPYERLLREPVVRLNLGEHDTPCDLTLDVPAGIAPARAAELARQAAALSRYASPRRPPEVFLAPRQGSALDLQLRVRGYLYDREHDDRFRSDLVERLHAAFTAELAAPHRAL